jgi:hypothetical protein
VQSQEIDVPDLRSDVHTIPLPRERETIFSLGARAWRLNSGTAPQVIGRALFGCSTAHRYVAVPAGLARLQATLPGVFDTTHETLKERTLLAPFLPLLPAKKRADLLAACRNSDPKLAQARSGLNRLPIALRLIKFCRGCARDQIEFGFSYWVSDQQFPGTWICRKHAQILAYVKKEDAPAWPLPEDCTKLALQMQASVATQLLYLKVQSVIDWLSSQKHVETAILQVMLRLRLRRAGLTRSELRWRASEIQHIGNLTRDHYKDCQAPDMAALNQGNWFLTALAERRHYYPLTWAMALALSEEVDAARLTQEYMDAFLQKPDSDLFGPQPLTLHSRSSPARLNDASASADSKRDALLQGGFSGHEVSGWLRNDPDLKLRSEAHRTSRRHKEAVNQIRKYLAGHPAALRINVLRARMSAYRWISTNDPAELSQLPAPPVSGVARQLNFRFARSIKLGTEPSRDIAKQLCGFA